jgi:putative transposase
MARLARIVIPQVAHHVTQRGNRRMPVFFGDDDRRAYLALLADACTANDTACLAWCLMDNHVHLILVPQAQDGLRAVLGEAHRRYTRRINFREGWRGHLFQARFASYPMDAAHLMNSGDTILNWNSVIPGTLYLIDAAHRPDCGDGALS